MTHTDPRPPCLPTRRAVATCLGLLPLGGFGTTRACAQATVGVSDWSVADRARVRLVDAGPSPRDAAQRLVGIQVELDPAYLTYWRSPGEAGVPPSVSFAGSTGFKAAAMAFPAPGRYSEDGTEAIGYKDGVVFPVLVTPEEAAKPVALKMTLNLAICERQCLPAKASASLVLAGDGRSPEADLVRDALARVPGPARLGQAGPLSVTAVDGLAGDTTLTVHVRAEGADVPLLFAEAPDPWFVQAGEGLWTSDGSLKYVLKVVSKPAEAASLPLRLTLVGADTAVEVPVTLDAPAPKP